MRVVIQRALKATVCVEGALVGTIDQGLLVFLAVHKEDTKADADQLVQKLIHLRIFSDDKGKMNLSLLDTGLSALIVSQFTLYGNCQTGRRPDFFEAAPPQMASELYLYFIEKMSSHVKNISTGVFGANMQVSLINDGPVTFVIDSKLS
jgi:D-tyrosyl-tRNA(Tyr) deacylase